MHFYYILIRLKIFNKSSDLSKRMKCLIENIMQRRAENWK